MWWHITGGSYIQIAWNYNESPTLMSCMKCDKVQFLQYVFPSTWISRMSSIWETIANMNFGVCFLKGDFGVCWNLNILSDLYVGRGVQMCWFLFIVLEQGWNWLCAQQCVKHVIGSVIKGLGCEIRDLRFKTGPRLFFRKIMFVLSMWPNRR